VLRFSALRLVMWGSVAGWGAWLNRLFWAFFLSTFNSQSSCPSRR
jgi:hypothetical protein